MSPGRVGICIYAIILLITIIPAQAQEKQAQCHLKFTIPEHNLYPENIAYDPVTGDFFLGSMGQSRILRIKPDGSYTDFVTGSEDGLGSSVGLKVDPVRRILWVCNGLFDLHEKFGEIAARTGMLAYNIDDKSLAGSWLLENEQPGVYFIFNDVAVANDGTAYATSTLIRRIYRITPDGKFESIHELEEGQHNNGISITPDNGYLFVTKAGGVFRYDLQSGETLDIQAPDKQVLNRIDGLYFYKGSLICIKPRLNLVTRVQLSDDLSKVESESILQKENDQFQYPTTGVIVGDKLVLVATSYANSPRDSSLDSQHGDVLIFEIDLLD